MSEEAINCLPLSVIRRSGTDIQNEFMEMVHEVTKINANGCGIIVAGFKVENAIPWLYWHSQGYVDSFSLTHTHNPKRYKEIKWAADRVAKMQEEVNSKIIICDVAFWCDLDIHLTPLEKYKKMTGNQFPGSPRH